MNSLVIFDSNFGNTKIIGEAIAKELSAKAISVSEFDVTELEGIDLLVVGCPINAWRPSPRMMKFLAYLAEGQLKGVKAAAFDTRVNLFIHGDAAKKIAAELKRAGAEIIADPMAFYVKGKKGPLFEGETEKAVEWAKLIK
jgi:flavodoxin